MYDWIANSVEQAISVFQEFSLDWNFSFKDGARRDEIDRCESELNLSLPRSYREFLLTHNGAQLFYSEAEERSDSSIWWTGSGIKIFGIMELLSYRSSRHQIASSYSESTSIPYSELEDQFILAFAYLGRIGTGDFCALDMANFCENECPVLACDQDYPPAEWKKSPIAYSFEEWLSTMFDRVVNHRSLPEYWFGDTLSDGSLRMIHSF